jgi:hypothetical protein
MYTVGDLKIDRSFDVDFSSPGRTTNLTLVALDLPAPQVVAVQFTAT